MENNYKEIVKKLMFNNKTISTMESCTGGGLVNAITNIEGASEVLKYSAITYSNEYKIKMGVDSKVIDKYTVYSMETADEMSKNITKFADSDYGIGITGQLNRKDPNNPTGEDNVIYISIYDKTKDKYYQKELRVHKESRELNKDYIIDNIIMMLEEILKIKD